MTEHQFSLYLWSQEVYFLSRMVSVIRDKRVQSEGIFKRGRQDLPTMAANFPLLFTKPWVSVSVTPLVIFSVISEN